MVEMGSKEMAKTSENETVMVNMTADITIPKLNPYQAMMKMMTMMTMATMAARKTAVTTMEVGKARRMVIIIARILQLLPR